MKIVNAKELEKNPTLTQLVEPENDLKNFLILLKEICVILVK